jgi:hypothetical protein
MIKYNGIIHRKRMSYLVMSGPNDARIEIPIDRATADRISKYLSQISILTTTSVERRNDEPSE